MGGGRPISEHQSQEPLRIVPHARTLRKARENVKGMVADCVSHKKTRNYLHHFVNWWVKTVDSWTYETLLESFIQSCWTRPPAAIAELLLQRRITELHTGSQISCPAAA